MDKAIRDVQRAISLLAAAVTRLEMIQREREQIRRVLVPVILLLQVPPRPQKDLGDSGSEPQDVS